MTEGLEHLSCYKRLKELGLFSLEKAGQNLMNIYKHLMRRYKDDRVFSVVPSDRTRGNGHKLKHGRFPLNIRKHFFTVGVTKHWYRLPRKVLRPPLRGDQTQTDRVQVNLLYPTSCCEQELGLYHLHSALPASDILGFCGKLAPVSAAEVRTELALQGSGEETSFPVARVTTARSTRLGRPQHQGGEQGSNSPSAARTKKTFSLENPLQSSAT